MVELGAKDPKIVGITAAMLDGTGLNAFAKAFPGRFFDVGISEEHAIGFSAGLAKSGLKPVTAIYSTFLQRGYDQIIHDVCLQNLPVVLCIDRSGLVGEDGPTHHGVFDIAYLRHIPNLTLMAPASPEELKAMLEFALSSAGPVAIRYPKGTTALSHVPALPIKAGKAQILKTGKRLAIISIGSMAKIALDTAALLSKKGIDCAVINARFVKPLDEELILNLCQDTKGIVTLEEGVLKGGFGSAVLELMERNRVKGVKVKRIGLPDKFIEHGKKSELFLKYNLTPDAICGVIMREVMQ